MIDADLPIIRSFWFGKPMNWICDLSMKSYIRQGHKFELYCYEEFPVPEGVIRMDANEIIPESASFQMMNSVDGIRGRYSTFANIFRYKLLFEKGGVWSDLDSICIKPLIFDDSIEVMFATENSRTGIEINNCNIFVAKSGNPLFAKLYTSSISQDVECLEHLSFNKNFIIETMEEMGIDWMSLTSSKEMFCPIPWFRIHQIFNPKHEFELMKMMEKTYAIHLYNNIIEADYPDYLKSTPVDTSFISQLESFVTALD
jgi:hypothetical protein